MILLIVERFYDGYWVLRHIIPSSPKVRRRCIYFSQLISQLKPLSSCQSSQRLAMIMHAQNSGLNCSGSARRNEMCDSTHSCSHSMKLRHDFQMNHDRNSGCTVSDH